MNQYGQLIKQLRNHKNMTQTQLAKTINVDPSHVCRIEKGKAACSISLLGKIAAVFGVSVSELLDDNQKAV